MDGVAPLAGAWIEIDIMRVAPVIDSWSLPLRERGLKSLIPANPKIPAVVAPLAGAWIEIPIPGKRGCAGYVAPLAGAWIEIGYDNQLYNNMLCRSPCGSVD